MKWLFLLKMFFEFMPFMDIVLLSKYIENVFKIKIKGKT